MVSESEGTQSPIDAENVGDTRCQEGVKPHTPAATDVDHGSRLHQVDDVGAISAADSDEVRSKSSKKPAV